MIELKRKVSNNAIAKSINNATSATYEIDDAAIDEVYDALDSKVTSNSSFATHSLNQEKNWLKKWQAEIKSTSTVTNGIIEVPSDVNVEQGGKNKPDYVDSGSCQMDFFLHSFVDNNPASSVIELNSVSKLIASGVVNNFRFYNMPGNSIIVLDYRKILDCIAFYYSYRELGMDSPQIENVLDKYSMNITNPFDPIANLISMSLAAYTSPENLIANLIEKETRVSLRDGDMFSLTRKLRVSTNCYQVIRGSRQITTWQGTKLPLKSNMLYKEVMDISASEAMFDIFNGVVNEINSNSELKTAKVLCMDTDCIAISVDKRINSAALRMAFNITLRLFNRLFEVPVTIYRYEKDSDIFTEVV